MGVDEDPTAGDDEVPDDKVPITTARARLSEQVHVDDAEDIHVEKTSIPKESQYESARRSRRSSKASEGSTYQRTESSTSQRIIPPPSPNNAPASPDAARRVSFSDSLEDIGPPLYAPYPPLTGKSTTPLHPNPIPPRPALPYPAPPQPEPIPNPPRPSTTTYAPLCRRPCPGNECNTRCHS